MTETEATPDTLDSLRQLAKAVGRSHTAVAKWAQRDDWPFRRVPPWDMDDVATVKAWAESTLQPDRNESAHEQDTFWRRYGGLTPQLPKLPDPMMSKQEHRDNPLAPLLDLPDILCGKIEKQIIAGKVKLSAEDMRKFVTRTAWLRWYLTWALRWLPSWLEGEGDEEIRRRLWAELHQRLEWFAWVNEDLSSGADGKKAPVRE